jgi:hypothetical protein
MQAFNRKIIQTILILLQRDRKNRQTDDQYPLEPDAIGEPMQ